MNPRLKYHVSHLRDTVSMYINTLLNHVKVMYLLFYVLFLLLLFIIITSYWNTSLGSSTPISTNPLLQGNGKHIQSFSKRWLPKHSTNVASRLTSAPINVESYSTLSFVFIVFQQHSYPHIAFYS